MDVILLKDVERLGSTGTIVHVKPGFARNYLLPRGLAVPAGATQRAALEETTRRHREKAQRIRIEAETLKQKLDSRPLTLKLTVGAHDKPFGAITTHDVIEALKGEGFPLDTHALSLEQPIKSLGTYEIPVRLHPEVVATLKLWVVKA